MPFFYKHIVPTKSTPNAPNQEINGMNAFWHSPGMNAIKAFPVWHLSGLKIVSNYEGHLQNVMLM